MMSFDKIKSDFLHEEYTYFKHKSGLDVYVFPKNMSCTYALFAIKYGSLDNKFKLEGDRDFTCVPDGIAHFLEHKMFESENGEDVFLRFAKTGACANAYTSNNITAYLFSCTDKLYESLEILLDFVTHPYFTRENVQKEQGIIAQEIKMYDDHPGSRLYYELLGALYQKHNVKINVAGTVESISEITPELLYSCYNIFYNLNNMALCVCGRAEAEQVCEICDRILTEAPKQKIIREYPSEPANVASEYAEAHLEVASPMFAIGVKDIEISEDPSVRLRKSAVADIAIKMLFGKTSRFYNELYESGLVQPGLNCEYEHNRSFSFMSIDGRSREPRRVYEYFLKYIKEIKQAPMPESEFEIAKRVKLASFVGLFDSTDDIANEFLSFIFDGATVFDYVKALSDIRYDEVIKFVNELFKESACSLAAVLPLKK